MGLALSNPYPIANFDPFGTLALTATTGAGGVSGIFTTSRSIQASSVAVYNAGTVLAFIGFGQGSATASIPTTETQNATPVPPGVLMILKKGIGNDTVAAITGASTALLYFCACEGA